MLWLEPSYSTINHQNHLSLHKQRQSQPFPLWVSGPCPDPSISLRSFYGYTILMVELYLRSVTSERGHSYWTGKTNPPSNHATTFFITVDPQEYLRINESSHPREMTNTAGSYMWRRHSKTKKSLASNNGQWSILFGRSSRSPPDYTAR